LFQRDSGDVYRATELASLSWLEHGFGTRLSSHWPKVNDVANLANIKQIHSARVLLADRTGLLGEGDAMISNRPGIHLAIRTADCLPVLIADRRNRAIAAIHAGWRGVVAEIVPQALRRMEQEFRSRPQDLIVAIGPGIGSCCFEVGFEVASQFQRFFPDRNDLTQRTKLDLTGTICRQLGRIGVSMSQVFTSGLCTCCDGELFESYRRDRDKAGRMVSLIGLVENA
jgi:purine-nucleoside/S-methyl-5'-thioadenosine phosphorylase / adenosine deaminase